MQTLEALSFSLVQEQLIPQFPTLSLLGVRARPLPSLSDRPARASAALLPKAGRVKLECEGFVSEIREPPPCPMVLLHGNAIGTLLLPEKRAVVAAAVVEAVEVSTVGMEQGGRGPHAFPQ